MGPSKIESLKNQNETLLLPAFLALERQLTSCQKQVENLENEISSKKREIRDLNVEIQKLNFENKSLESRLISTQDKLSGKVSEESHKTLLTELKNQKNEEINKLQANLVLMKQAQTKLLEQNQFYEENQKIIDKDARTVVRRGNEIVQLKKEVASLHQRLEAALSRKTDKEKNFILCDSVDQNSRAALEQRIKHLEYTLKDKDEFIKKMNRQSQQHHIEQENREKVESLCSSIQLDDSIVKNQNDRILSLQTQLKEVHRRLEECQTETQKCKNEVAPYKKRCSALEAKLVEESKKVGILNSLLLEAKAKNQTFEAEAGDNETKVEELRKLMVISDEKLEMANLKIQEQNLKLSEYSEELTSWRQKDINGVNAIAFQRLNDTRNRIAELEKAHSDRLELIGRSHNLMKSEYDLNESVVNESDFVSDLGMIMKTVSQLHQQIRTELDD